METVESPNNTLISDKLDDFDDTEIYNLTDTNGNLNISEITADEVCK